MSKADDIRVVLKNPAGEFNVDRNTHVIAHCSDNKFLEVPKSLVAKCTFLKAPSGEEENYEFEYPATILDNLVRWTQKYGVDGKAVSPLPHPCTYRMVTFVFIDAWDLDFFNTRLCGLLNRQHFLETMTAADKFKMEGLLDFMSIGLGCKLRSEEDPVIIHDIMGIPKDTEITEEDMAQVSKDYPWFDDATKPVDAK